MISLGVNWLPETAYLYLLIFGRVGAMIMMLPALGERMFPTRIKLGFALMLTLVMYPAVSGLLPAYTGDMAATFAILGHEIIVGLILGTIMRLIVSATQTAGSVIAFQAGLSMAMTADPSQGGVQGAIIGNFLALLGTALIFAADLHHMLLAAIYDSYVIFSPDAPLMFNDAAMMAIDVVARAFAIGVQMAAPFIIFGLVFYLGLGLLSKLMPQLQVFFIAMPANISIAMILFALLLTMMMAWYLSHFEAEISMFLG